MARLFITERELNFISDITKELIKDVVGQKIYYYPVSELKTKTHDIYNESMEKVFDHPIEIEALVDNIFQVDTQINEFGIDAQYKVEVFLHSRDILERGINVTYGDIFSYGDIFFEITEVMIMKTIFGQVENKDGIKLVGTKARDGQFKALIKGPTDRKYTDADAIQKTFEQQRGFEENSLGQTGDTRALVEAGALEPPISKPRKVNEAGGALDNSTHGSSFYSEDED
jgi:hypothetical protein